MAVKITATITFAFARCLLVFCLLQIVVVAAEEQGQQEQVFASEQWTPESGIYDAARCGLPMKSPTIEATTTATAVDNEENPAASAAKLRRVKRYRPPSKSGGATTGRKVMGGQPVQAGAFPWAVAIYHNPMGYQCAGTLISKRHVLTAAHCFHVPHIGEPFCHEKPEPCCNAEDAVDLQTIVSDIEVHIGSVCLNEMVHLDSRCDGMPEQKKFRIKNISSDYVEFFRSGCHKNDFALLELDLDSEEDKQALPPSIGNHICLVHLDQHVLLSDWHGLAVPTSYGWGNDPLNENTDIALGAPNVPVLQRLDMPGIWPPDECMAKQLALNDSGSEDLLCTMEKADADVCSGDSGGGMISQYEDSEGVKRWYQLGLVSGGTDCKDMVQRLKLPGVQLYTNVTYYKEPINNFVVGLSSLQFKESDQPQQEEQEQNQQDVDGQNVANGGGAAGGAPDGVEGPNGGKGPAGEGGKSEEVKEKEEEKKDYDC